MTEPSDDVPSEALTRLAEAWGISTTYWSFFGERITVAASTLRALLGTMGVPAGTTDEEAAAALERRRQAPWRRPVPPALVVRAGDDAVLVAHRPAGRWLRLVLIHEDGAEADLPLPEHPHETAWIDAEAAGDGPGGIEIARLHVPLPRELPLGWHRVRAESGPEGHGPDRTAECVLAVTPPRLPAPPGRDSGGRSWGIMAQLYSVRSERSWGLGDFADLADLASLAGDRGADFVLVNPFHAAEVVPPLEPSPYLPATRRFVAPLYLRPEDIREASYLGPDERAALDAARARVAASNRDPDRLDRDAVWTAKRAALELVFAVPRSRARQADLDRFTADGGRALADFALWCALQEQGEDMPADLASPAVEALRERLADRIAFFRWLQWAAEEQLATAQAQAARAGMTIGVMHDLAVGVHRDGSDVWSRRDLYGVGATVGAPPDMYNQQGQDWSQPPWLPHRLEDCGYAPLRDLLRALLRHAGALRIDHIIGLFRLWWIPRGLPAWAGAYVRYDHEAMIGVLALEAWRAGAVVVGEDLGNVEPWVREYLESRGILGTSVLWFEHDEHGPRSPEHYRESVLATVTTHDLPPTAGYLAGAHVELRARLGLLNGTAEEERRQAEEERARMIGAVRARGLLGEETDEEAVVAALHRHVAASPSRLIGIALTDAVGERRTQNQPGTHREYPNWQVPLADAEGNAVLIEDLPGLERFERLLRGVDETVHWR